MLALAKDVSRVAPVRKQLRRVSNNSLVLGVNKACAGYLSVQSFGNSSKNYNARNDLLHSHTTVVCGDSGFVRNRDTGISAAITFEIGPGSFCRSNRSPAYHAAYADK